MNTFDVTGPLPRTTTQLEASAGTGKTYAIAALTARYIAEDGADIADLLLITFGNHASSELRTRVFERLDSTVKELDAQLAGAPTPPEDAVSRHLASADLKLRRDRLADALDRFNEATIVTTHAFCDAMLAELGILADWDRNETVGPDSSELIEQCTVDTYLRLYRADPEPPIEPLDARRIGRAACLTNLPLMPEGGAHREFADAVRTLYTARKATLGLRTFNDVTSRLRDALADPVTGPVVREVLRRRFPYVLVDEFQDTDPEQWAIIESAFVADDRPTVLIGDPKQSIYGFRGADLGAYLAAQARAQVATLGTNYRSDQGLVDGVVELFGQRTLGAEQVVVHPLEAAHTTDLPAVGPHRVRIRTAAGGGSSDSAPVAIERDLVAQTRQLLHTFEPSDIAVLVRTGARAQRLAEVLTEAGHPAAITGSQSVWKQPAAKAWATLLRAMDNPTQATIRLAALTPLIGSGLGTLLAEGSAEPARVSSLIREMRQAFEAGGIPAVLSGLRAATSLDARLVRQPEGDRLLTDVGHVAELLAASPAHTLTELIEWIERDRTEEDADSLRISTDETAIRIMTLHAAKGLEFPVVLLPETEGIRARFWEPFSIVEGNRRHLYIGPRPHGQDDITRTLTAQNLDEELRLLYVGFTRAKHLSIAWHVDQDVKAPFPLRLLMKQLKLPRHVLIEPMDTSDADPPGGAAPSAQSSPAVGLSKPGQLRDIDRTWRRTSYSGLTAGLHDVPSGVVVDEPEAVDVSVGEPNDPALAEPSPMAGLPAGAAFGTVVHEIFERLDWSPPVLEMSAAELVGELGPHHGFTAAETAQLTDAVIAAVRTPLTPLAEMALTDLPTANRLPELDFDLPLADAGAPATLEELARLMAEHLPATDPLAAYPARLAASEAAPAVLNGFLTGSIDGVLKLPDGRFAVVDYKTNRMTASADEVPTLGHYTPAAMAEAMMQAHYPLQAMLYCVALHRYLGLRLDGYSPGRHLAGVGYLFVRGMAGPDTPVVDGSSCGVFGWFPSPELVIAASNLLGGTRG